MSQIVGDPHPDVGKWLDSHHQVSEGIHGDNIHVFAVEQGDVFASPSAKKTFEVSFNIGPLTITIIIVFDTTNKTITITAYGKLPFLPQFTIASGSGSYDKGVVLKFSLVVISGTFTFTIKSGWLWLHYDVKVLGREYKGDVKLIPVP